MTDIMTNKNGLDIMTNKMNIDDEKTLQNYEKILKRSEGVVGTGHVESEMPNNSEECETLDDMQVDLFFYALQDKFTNILSNTNMTTYMKCRNKKQIMKIKLTSVTFDFLSNCCMNVKFGYTNAHIKNKKGFLENNISVFTRDNNTNVSKIQLKISNDICGDMDIQQLIIYTDDCKIIAFTIISDIEMDECAVSFKIGYMDYEWL